MLAHEVLGVAATLTLECEIDAHLVLPACTPHPAPRGRYHLHLVAGAPVLGHHGEGEHDAL